jgi:hypothetical protein
MEFPN